MIIQAAEVKSSHGRRYDAEYILECLLFSIKSATAYNHLRLTNLLPLPDPRHLRDLLRGMACKFGMNQTALDAIERKAQRSSDFDLMLGNDC